MTEQRIVTSEQVLSGDTMTVLGKCKVVARVERHQSFSGWLVARFTDGKGKSMEPGATQTVQR